ncbi:4335_t:CDS:2 [Funneliformis mosseae]|uniref:4335_t:CDS:1 n=1 Tax=Funneliformis mosseae TaxID=27381 RepID=A0A9N9FKU8_FUNMO|nr:4335_t:CDS:2 [Funneliformis mosseae]
MKYVQVKKSCESLTDYCKTSDYHQISNTAILISFSLNEFTQEIPVQEIQVSKVREINKSNVKSKAINFSITQEIQVSTIQKLKLRNLIIYPK